MSHSGPETPVSPGADPAPSAQILALVAARTDNAVILANSEGLVVWVNEGFTRLTGYSLEEARNQKPGHLLQGPDTNPETVRFMRDQIRRQAQFQTEILNHRKDGSAYWASIEVQPLLDAEGKVTHWMSVQSDISSLREAERALREQAASLEQRVAARTLELEQSSQQFEDLVELAPDAFVLADSDGRIQRVNREAERLFGWRREELIGRSVDLLVPAELRAHHAESRQAYIAHGTPLDLAHRGALRALRKDGSEFPAEIALGRLNTPHGPLVTSVIRDISFRIQAEKAIRDTEALYRNAIAAADAVAYIREHQPCRYTFVGAGIEQLTGYTAAEMTPDLWNRISIRSVMQGEGAGLSLEEAVARSRAGNLDHWRCDTLIRHRDGTERWIAEASVEVPPVDGKPASAVGILVDITERKHTEESLRTSETGLKQAQQLAHIGNWDYDLLTGELRWSEEIYRIFGLNPTTTTATYGLFFEYVHPDDRTAVEQVYQQSIATHTPLTVTHRLVMPGGRTRFVQQEGRTLYNDQGTPIRSFGTIQDITERKESEEQLLESRALLQQVTESIEEAFWLYDHREQRIVYVSPGYQRLWGRSIDALYQRASDYLEGIHAEDRPAVIDALTRQAKGEPTVAEYRVVTPDGTLRWILDRSFPVPGPDGRPFRSAGVARDITQRRQAEEDLRMFRTIADGANYGVAIAALSGHVQYVNETWAREHGWKVGELLGRELTLFHRNEDLPRVQKLIQHAIKEGGFTAEEVWHIRQDGSTYPTLMSCARIDDTKGQPSFLAATALNISDRVLGQRRLQLRNEVLRLIAENAAITEVLQFLCEQVESIHPGCLCHVMQRQPDGMLRVLVGPRLTAEMRQQMEPMPVSPTHGSCAAAAFNQTPVFSCNTATEPCWESKRDLARDFGIGACWSTPILDGGSVFGTFAIGFPTPRTPTDLDRGFVEECARLAGLAVQHHGIQHALMESSAHFRTLADSGQALVWTTDTSGSCNYLNKVWLQFTGRTSEQELGSGWLESVHPDDRERIRRESDPLIGRRERFTLLYRIRRHDGEYRSIEVFATPRHNVRGDYLGYIGHCLDVTDRLAAQRQLNRSQRLEAIGQLAGGIAHDLNNALAPILMTSTLLRLDHPGAGDLIETVESSARRCADMVRQLVTFAKGAEGKRQPIAPAEAIHGIERIVRSTFPRSIDLRLLVPADAWQVLGDATQLHQILLNLCVNARDAMPQGGHLTLRTENVTVDETFAMTTPEAHLGRYLLIEVEDTGTGIPPEIIDRIFEPFFTTKDPDRGTGLGLSTVVGIVKGHGGFIRVYSQPGHGSRFNVYLPALADDHPNPESPHAAQKPSVDGRGLSVLVVDDDANVRQALATVLASLGFKVIQATDGAEGLVIAVERRTEIRLVITDVHMPHLGGVQLVQALHRVSPKLPIIVTSGRIDEHDERQFHEYGVASILPKPFTHEALVAALAAVLLGRNAALGLPPYMPPPANP